MGNPSSAEAMTETTALPRVILAPWGSSPELYPGAARSAGSSMGPDYSQRILASFTARFGRSKADDGPKTRAFCGRPCDDREEERDLAQ